jgi:hypothetical protein
MLAAILLLLFTDASHHAPLFVPGDAFSAPRKYGLSASAIAQIDHDMTAMRETRKAIGDDPDACATPIAQPQPLPIDASGTILDAASGWDTRKRYVTTLAHVRIEHVQRGDLKPGDEVLVELPFGVMHLGRTRWCTGAREVKSGETIAFEGELAKSEPAHIDAVVK